MTDKAENGGQLPNDDSPASDLEISDDGYRKPIRIVAIGASAGGLDPFERFFDAVPADNGLAFVVVQHLSPNFKSMMDELLARHSDMAIHRIEQGTKIEANAIYLNQPRLVPTVKDGAFHITDTSESVDPNLPINVFLESLARDRGHEAIGVILSGTGSDGTKGCHAIKRAGGTVFVQEPASAKFDGMPNSVINKELADVIAPPEVLADMVLRHANGEAIESLLNPRDSSAGPVDYIFSLLAERYGTDFRCYKPSTIERRIRRRYEMCGLNNFQDYADHISSDRDEIAALYNDLLIDVTAFFRDGEAFKLLDDTVVADIGSRMADDYQVRIWVPACSSGEEPYSIAILLAEYARKHDVPLNVKILATDIHHRSLDAASAGIYPEESMKSISADRVGRYFDKQGSYYHIRQEIRRLVVFTPHSLFRDPPFTRMDLVSCRNMLIYFKEPAQNKAMALFHFALKKHGYLFLGPSETLGKISHEFETIDQRWRIFRKNRDVRLVESTTVLRHDDRENKGQGSFPSGVPRGGMRDMQMSRPDSRRAFNDAMQSLLAEYAPPGFLLNRDGDLVHTFGEAGRFITVGEGGFSQRIQDLVQEDLKLAVSAGLERLKTQAAVPFHRRASIRAADGAVYGVTINIETLADSVGTADYLLMTIVQDQEKKSSTDLANIEYIADDEAAEILQQRVRELERDLSSTEESLQTTIEELETSNEELQATNEELMASNEELQSTNEELHSVNEELYTVSAEHQRKIDELTDLTNDMDQLLKSTEIGTIFLDADLRIRRFTPAATNTFNLIAQDISRPFEHITHRFDEDVIEGMLAEVGERGEAVEHEVQVRGHYYLLRVLPYVPLNDGPPEFVITIIDINEIRTANNRIEEMSSFYQGVLTDIAEYVVRWRVKDRKIVYCNEAYADLMGKPAEQLIDSSISELFADPAERDTLFQQWSAMAPGDIEPMRVRQETRGGNTIYREGTIRAIGDSDGNVIELQSTSRDATQDVKYLESLEALIDTSQSPDQNDYLARVDEFLSTGCAFFGLESGVLKRFQDDGFKVEVYHGPDAKSFPVGVKIGADQTLCSIVMESQEVLAVANLATSPYLEHPAFATFGVKSYISAPISKEGVPYGTVSFSSKHQAKDESYSASQISFIILLARWLGYKIEREAQLLALRRNEKELKFLFDSVPARIWYKDDKNIMLRLNETAAASMGMTSAEAAGTDTYDLFPDMAKKYHQDDLEVLNSGKPRYGIIEEYTPRDGKHGWTSTDKIPFESDVTGDRNLLVVSTDVTSLKTQELALQKLNTELALANDGLRQFAYVASHDMQEPLRKIQQFSELLSSEYQEKLDDEGQYFLSVVSDSATRMSALIRDLLTYSRTAHRELDRKDIDLEEQIDTIKQMLAVSIEETGAKIEYVKLPTVAGDETMVQQLFSNLIGNAVKYRAPKRKPAVKISSRRSKDGLTVTVKDNGIGMEQKYIDRIFEPFTRLQSDEALKGSGIGLAICKSVCDRHGWQIEVDSEPGKGSRFVVKIPL